MRLPTVSVSEKVLEGNLFSPPLKETVGGLALSIARAHSRSAPLRHILLYGPPGTGKTMVARRIATLSGLDYAIMSGGDLGPLGQVMVYFSLSRTLLPISYPPPSHSHTTTFYTSTDKNNQPNNQKHE
jgi:hypothetical protein